MRVIGTAGHVDHGKSTLIQALTGTHPDRLKEEKERKEQQAEYAQNNANLQAERMATADEKNAQRAQDRADARSLGFPYLKINKFGGFT